MSPLAALGLGLGLGFVTGMPIGVINVAIVDAATTGRRQLATGLGLGGALADAMHATAAFLGIAQLVTARPEVVRILAIGAAVVIIGYAAVAWRARRPESGAFTTRPDRSIARGVLVGVGLTLPNPGALGAWVAVAAIWPAATALHAILVALGVGVGSAVWFILLGRWVGTLRRDHPVLKAIPQVAIIALIALAIVGVARTI